MVEMIDPLAWNASMLTSSTVPETDYTEWAFGTFVVGDKRMVTSLHRCYECVVGHTSTDASGAPNLNLTGDTPKWIDLGATNRHAMFDEKYGTQTTATDSFTFVITPGKIIDSLGLLNLRGTAVTISSTVPGLGEVFSRVVSLRSGINVTGWRSYFLAPIIVRDAIYITDLPPYVFQVITITISGSGPVAIGNLSMGTLVNLGRLQYRPKIGIIDFSVKETDKFGVSKVVEHPYSKWFRGTLEVDNAMFDQLEMILARVRAKPVVVIGLGNLYTSMMVWGFFKEFELELVGVTVSGCSFYVEGLT